MRLVLTVEHYYPAIGGAERVVQRIGEGLSRRGHDILVITSGARSSELLNGVRLERFPVTGNLANGIRGNVDEPLQTIEAFEPDIVMNYAAQTWTSDVCTRFLEDRDFRLVLAPCGFSALRSSRYAQYFARMRDFLPQYDALIFHSSIYQDWHFAQAAGSQNCHVIANAADDPRPYDPSAIPALPRVVTVGSHVRSKGHADFFRSVRGLQRRSVVVQGVLVAPPRRGLDAFRGCQARCSLQASLPGSQVDLVDGRPTDSVPRALAGASLLLFPSGIECAPLVILEAMAASVPWISYDVGNVRELRGGVVVAGLDELVDAAEAVLAGNGASLGSAGHRAWHARHRWADVVTAYERLFAELVSDQSSTARDPTDQGSSSAARRA